LSGKDRLEITLFEGDTFASSLFVSGSTVTQIPCFGGQRRSPVSKEAKNRCEHRSLYSPKKKKESLTPWSIISRPGHPLMSGFLKDPLILSGPDHKRGCSWACSIRSKVDTILHYLISVILIVL